MLNTEIKESKHTLLLHSNQSWQNIAMANARDIFIMCFALSCVENVIAEPSDIRKNHEEMMGPNAFETIEKMVAEMVEKRDSEMVEARVADMVEARVVEMVDFRVAEMVETRVVQEMSKVKDEIKKELAFDVTEECKNMNERDENDVIKRENFDTGVK